ncbi:MAG: phosphoribosyltransferase [Planctomycetia bacterium]|nr:phosphoribosyltransferase [Planctomycetia bacterium]
MRPFRDRQDAGRQLAEELARLGYSGSLVLGIPRGGVPVAREVAEALGGVLGVVVARKIRAPGQPELAIGAVAADGACWINRRIAAYAGADQAWLDAETRRQQAEAARREKAFNGARAAMKGRDVIIVDDGIATGATAIVACRSARRAGAKRVVLAVPVGPPESVRTMKTEADVVVCLLQDEAFQAVGQYYDDFEQVEDAEVTATLEGWKTAR